MSRSKKSPDPEVDRGRGAVVLPDVNALDTHIDPVAPAHPPGERPEPKARFEAVVRKDGKVVIPASMISPVMSLLGSWWSEQPVGNVDEAADAEVNTDTSGRGDRCSGQFIPVRPEQRDFTTDEWRTYADTREWPVRLYFRSEAELANFMARRGAPKETEAERLPRFMTVKAYAAHRTLSESTIEVCIREGMPLTGKGHRRRVPVADADEWFRAVGRDRSDPMTLARTNATKAARRRKVG